MRLNDQGEDRQRPLSNETRISHATIHPLSLVCRHLCRLQVCCEVQRAADPHPGGGRVLLQAAARLQARASPQHHAGRRSVGKQSHFVFFILATFSKPILIDQRCLFQVLVVEPPDT